MNNIIVIKTSQHGELTFQGANINNERLNIVTRRRATIEKALAEVIN
jgi:hypothetical protein